MPHLAMIAAVGRNGAIGAGNRLPWRLPSDLRRFKALTMGKPVVMGRRTFMSIGRPLPGRAVLVVTTDAGFGLPAGVERVGSIEGALDRGAAMAAERGVDEIVIAGGGTLYRALMDRAQALYLTEVDLAPEADTFFPAIERTAWTEVRRETPDLAPGDEARIAFVDYVRAP